MSPSNSQWLSILRSMLLYAFAYATGKGLLTTDQVNGLLPVIMDAAPYVAALGVAVWGVIAKRPSATVLDAKAIPGVSVRVDTSRASPAPDSVIALAKDPKVQNVNPAM